MKGYCKHFRCRIAAAADLARVAVFLHGAERRKAEAELKAMLFHDDKREVKCRFPKENL